MESLLSICSAKKSKKNIKDITLIALVITIAVDIKYEIVYEKERFRKVKEIIDKF